jgi:glycosyltransferase involved in cell wall biosynthesis
MSDPSQNRISVLILTLNEELCLPRCLQSVSWSDDVVVLDSFSRDATREVCAQFENVRFYQRQFDDYASQRNHALHEIEYRHEWLFIIDADEICPEPLWLEMESAVREAKPETVVFMMRRKDFFMGKWMRHNNMYPVWLERLARPRQVRYERAVNEHIVFEGAWAPLQGHLHHFPFAKGLDFWLERHNRYSTMEAANRRVSAEPVKIANLLSRNPIERRKTLKNLSAVVPARFLVFFLYNFFVKFCFLDGRRGIYFVLLKTFYEFTIDLKALPYDHSAAAIDGDEKQDARVFRIVTTGQDNARTDTTKVIG